MSQLFIHGPWISDPQRRSLWSAKVEILQIEWFDPANINSPLDRTPEIRQLLAESQGATRLFPRLAVLRGRVIEVVVRRFGKEVGRWRALSGDEQNPEIETAHEALLLVS